MQPDERAFAAGEHPHVPAGSSSGGQFAPKKQSKATKSTPAKHPPANHAPAKHGTGHAPAKNDGGNFAYDGKTGAGYGMPGGSPKVKSLQADLIRLGLASKTDKAFNDGKYGPKTSAAVKKAQKALGMKPDGIATPALIAKLAAAKNLPHRSLDEDDVFLRAGAELHISITDRPVVKQVTEGRSHGSQMKEGATMAVERRYTLVPVELRVVGDKPRIGGYAAMFERVSQNLGGFVEVVERSFFNKSRGDGWPDVMARYNHDDNMLLGTSGAGTLQLSLDETGLDYLVDPPQSRADVVELVQRGDVRKSSFAFRLPKEGDEWTMSDQGLSAAPARHRRARRRRPGQRARLPGHVGGAPVARRADGRRRDRGAFCGGGQRTAPLLQGRLRRADAEAEAPHVRGRGDGRAPAEEGGPLDLS
jgi:HK97 family phage prohead protease